MASNYNNIFYKDYEKAINENAELRNKNKENNKTIANLNNTIKTLNDLISSLTEEVKELKEEILKLKANNNKNSNNSSKPSSTNGFKKVITNRREKSDKPKGGQKNHESHKLDFKLNQFLNSGNVVEEIIDVNKTEMNKDKKYIERIVIDIKITKTLKRYRYYPNEHGKYNIPKCHNQKVQYGSLIKAISVDLMNNLYNSTDGVTRFIEDITNDGITLSKGTLINWNNLASENLQPQIYNIEEKLLNAYYINHDESQIKVNGDGYNILCACNDKYTRLWTSEHKSQEALEKINFVTRYKGIIVKDGTELYNKYGLFLSQCGSHIQRYLKGIYDFIDHKGPKKMSEFFTKYNNLRNELIGKDIMSFTDQELKEIYAECDSILNEWEKELKEDYNNYLFEEEFKLWKRLKYDNKQMDSKIRGDRDEVLYFLKDFLVPFTNNAAEASQRGVKIKQKIGKFRSIEGANSYSIIKSCILTYKKNNVNVLSSLISAFENNPVVI